MKDLTVNSADLPARWYVVNGLGLATLCKDESDALWLVAECEREYPRHGPYRAVLLGDVQRVRELVQDVRDANAAASNGVLLTPGQEAAWFRLMEAL